MENSGLALDVSLDRLNPASSVRAAEGRGTKDEGEAKPRRREPIAGREAEELAGDFSEQVEHRIDSLA